MSSDHTPRPIDPDVILDEYARQLAREYRDKLAEAYVDSAAAHARFRDEAGSRSPADAAMLMRDNPGHFGELKDGGGEAARAAGMFGARAYHARIAQDDPRVAAQVLDQAFTNAAARTGADPERVRATWDALSRAYGPEAGAVLFPQRAKDVFGPASEADAASIARIAAARDQVRLTTGLAVAPSYVRSPALPWSLAEERSATASLPAGLQERLIAAADGMRRRLAIGYDDALGAEARLHALLDEHGVPVLDRVAKEPALLGQLRSHPGGPAAAEAAARAGVAYARLAYEFHHSRLPDAAEELEAREALAAVRRSARDPERGMEGVQEAIQLHGPELAAHLEHQRRERGPDRGTGRGGPGGNGVDRGVTPEGSGAGGVPRAGRGVASSGDPAVDEALRAHERMQEAEDLSVRARDLRTERGDAERVLARLDEQDRTLNRASRDFRAVAEVVYRDPAKAVDAWEKLVLREGGHLERAREHVLRHPDALGPLRSERHPGRRGMLGITTTQPAREAVPRLLGRATEYTQAQRAASDPVEWVPPGRQPIRGRENVRAEARTVIGDRQEQIASVDRRLDAVGGVGGSKQTAQRALGSLSPAQRQRATAHIARSHGAGAGRAAGALVSQGVQAARVAKTLGEGPAGL
jgi:hypothetical protein